MTSGSGAHGQKPPTAGARQFASGLQQRRSVGSLPAFVLPHDFIARRFERQLGEQQKSDGSPQSPQPEVAGKCRLSERKRRVGSSNSDASEAEGSSPFSQRGPASRWFASALV
jgi:hypothetical protein